MRRSTERILTTHCGSLPRPDDLARMMYDVLDGGPESPALAGRVTQAVADVVERQLDVGIDVISDGEMGKFGFSNYVLQRFGGFGETAQFVPTDLVEFPTLAAEVVSGDGWEHLRIPVLDGPIESRGTDAIEKEIDDLRAALGTRDPDDAFIGAITPGQLAYNFPNRHYSTHEAYIEASAEALRPEYEAIVQAGFNLQLDSPDAAMACHAYLEGTDLEDPRAHLATSIEILNDALSGLPPEKIRLHVCWGNYPGPHHKDVGLSEIVEPLLRANVGFIATEAANPRHAHEWEVWEQVELPEDKALIPGVIDTKTNIVEHPRAVAQRIERFASIVGRERVVAGTDCGFSTFVGLKPCDPGVAWLKLQALVEGARIASERLWGRAEPRPPAAHQVGTH